MVKKIHLFILIGGIIFLVNGYISETIYFSLLPSFLNIFPYFFGVLLGGNAHNPSALGFYLGLFFEGGLVGLLLYLIVKKINIK